MIESPVMVIAGPGTGKTEILTLRIANILKQTDTEPENILALTFTESGRITMRRRLAEIIGSPAYQITITTFHSFCNDIIQKYPEEFPHIIGSEPITEVDQIRTIEKLLKKLPLELLKPFGDPLYYTRSILVDINKLKREGIDHERFRDIVKEEKQKFENTENLFHIKGPHKGKMKGVYLKEKKEIDKNKELTRLYREYQKTLRKNKQYDFNDMIMETLKALESNEDLLRILQEQYQYVLVDEHQDTNNAQNKILELLLSFHPNPNIFVVGDEKQAIFRFQGASLENFLYFKNLYPEAQIITLEESYRAHQTILDSAESIIPGKKKLRAQVEHIPKKIEIFACSRPEQEEYLVARHIQKKIEEGTRPGEIAVLYRENRDAFLYADALRKLGVLHQIESDQDILEDKDIEKLILILKTIEDLGNEESLAEALHIDFLNIPPLDIYKLIQESYSSRISLYEIMRKADSETYENPKRIKKTFRAFEKWKRISKNHPLPHLLEKVLEESGFIHYMLEEKERGEKMEKLRTLFDEIKKFIESHKRASLKNLLAHIETLETHNILVKRTSALSQNKVHLLTAHKSKGLEFEYVYIVGAYDGHWGNKRKPDPLPLPQKAFSKTGAQLEKEEKNEDERRLFYVALTRAKKGAIVTYSKENTEARELLPTQFIAEIKSELKEEKEVKEYEDKAKSDRNLFIAKKEKEEKETGDEKEYFKTLFENQGLSVTALNNYLSCPWKYFYTNLIRIPKLPATHQMFGIAMHAALKDFFEKLKQGEESKELLIQRFQWQIGKQPITEDFESWERRGREALDGYFENYKGSWQKNTLGELNMKGILLEDIKLTGKLDKIEFIDDAGGVNVIDYKTGKPKSRNVIEGNTKDSDGGMKRQIIFYNVLLNRYKNGKHKMKSGEIDFVEPNERGIYKKEVFKVEEEEVKELEELIKKTSNEIQNLVFWELYCDNKECEFCRLRSLMA